MDSDNYDYDEPSSSTQQLDIFTDEEILDELKEEPVKLDENFNNVIVVDSLPVAEKEKYSKLLSFVQKFFSKWGNVVDTYMPLDEATGKTAGLAFVEFDSEASARNAVMEADNKPFDKTHTIRVNTYNDFQRFAEVPETFEAKAEDFQAKEHNSKWLLDGRAQYVFRHGNSTEIWWNDPLFVNNNGRRLVYAGEEHTKNHKQWTEQGVAWSPRGSFLATFHQQGVVLWGGDAFARVGRFQHPGVRFLEFSPCENFLITCNSQERDPECIIVWDVVSGKKLRAFENNNQPWPSFKWSFDESYIARISKDKQGKDVISVYQVPEMGLLNKTSIPVPSVGDIQWCPTRNYLSYWVPERGNIPAKVSIMSLPSREIVRDKHLYSVSDIKMYWQSKGSYLAVKMTRNKSKKTSTNFEIFRLDTKEVPVESMEIDDSIVAFAWEPNGNRFAIIHTDANSKTNVSFYLLNKKQLVLLETLRDRECNSLFWSPSGDYIVMATMGPQKGSFELFDVTSMASLATREHFMCNEVEWDPTGRYVITAVCQPFVTSGSTYKYGMDNGYMVWSLDGKGNGVYVSTTNVSTEKTYQVMWRPRPPTMLSEAQQKEMLKNIKDKYYRRFEQEDEKTRISQMGEAEQRKAELREEWKEYRSRRIKEYQEEAEHRRNLRGDASDEDEFVETEQILENEISMEQEITDL